MGEHGIERGGSWSERGKARIREVLYRNSPQPGETKLPSSRGNFHNGRRRETGEVQAEMLNFREETIIVGPAQIPPKLGSGVLGDLVNGKTEHTADLDT